MGVETDRPGGIPQCRRAPFPVRSGRYQPCGMFTSELSMLSAVVMTFELAW